MNAKVVSLVLVLGLGPIASHSPPVAADPTQNHPDAKRSPARRSAPGLRRWTSKWREFASGTHDVSGDFLAVRRSSLLHAPLEAHGRFEFTWPDTLRWVQSDPAIELSLGNSGLTFAPGPGQPAPDVTDARRERTHPAARWLSQRLLALFADGDAEALIGDSIVRAPRATTPRLFLEPPPQDPARRKIRELRITLDPTSGSVRELRVTGAFGDRLTMSFRDLRRNSVAR